MLKKLLAIIAGATVLSCGLPEIAQAISFNQISQVYFFGDSLTDSGFNDVWSVPAPPPPGKAPTFTTFGGYTWSQYVARDIKGFILPIFPGPTPPDTITNNSIEVVPGFVSGTLNGVDFACGGSTTNSTGLGETWAPSLHRQVTYYLSISHQNADPRAVYFVWEGANDILKLLSGPTLPTQLQLLLTAQTAAINIANDVGLLAAAGAQRVVVFALPNLGTTPLITITAATLHLPQLPAQMKTVSFTFNSMLNQELGRIISKYGTKMLYIDTYTLLDNVILATKAGKPYVISGQSFRFVNYTSPACNTVPTSIYCPSTAPTGYIFADTLHPTNEAHRVLSLQVEDEIRAWA